MPCNGMEGVDWGSVEARDAKDQIKALAKIVDQQGQDLCALRTLVVGLMQKAPYLPEPKGDFYAAKERIIRREAEHAEADAKGSRP